MRVGQPLPEYREPITIFPYNWHMGSGHVKIVIFQCNIYSVAQDYNTRF